MLKWLFKRKERDELPTVHISRGLSSSVNPQLCQRYQDKKRKQKSKARRI